MRQWEKEACQPTWSQRKKNLIKRQTEGVRRCRFGERRYLYESGVQLQNEKNIDHEIIPSFLPLPVEELIEPKDNIIFISVDVETTSNDNNGGIIELSASYNNRFFDQYVLPEHDVREKSSQITSLRVIGNVLLYKGSPVKTVGMRECAKLFINWLDSIHGEMILFVRIFVRLTWRKSWERGFWASATPYRFWDDNTQIKATANHTSAKPLLGVATRFTIRLRMQKRLKSS